MLTEGLDLPAGVTLLVGENGSGKSTLVEAVAMAFGLSPEGGSTHARHSTYETESELWKWLRLERSAGWVAVGVLPARRDDARLLHLPREPTRGSNTRDPDFHRLSHGESFIELLRTRFDSPGLYCLDEPEAALSFSGADRAGRHPGRARAGRRAGALRDALTARGRPPRRQPARGRRLGDCGGRPSRSSSWWPHWRSYLDQPMRYLRHVL